VSGASTPLMQQYREIKARHQDAILFFRMGDFYEMFHDDAETAARVLGLTLTSRNNGGASDVPLAGVPVKAAADYLRKLVQQGYRVAVCEQVEDPKLAKGLVRREVIETITPGAAFADDLLDDNRANYVVSVHISAQAPAAGVRADDTIVGIAAADLSTGELRVLRVTAADAPAHLARLAPRELVLARGAEVWPAGGALTRLLRAVDGVLRTERDAWEFDAALAQEELARQFRVASLEGLGFGSADVESVGALGALVRYLRDLQPGGLPHLARPIVEHAGATMPLDDMTRRNLELVESLRGGADGTVLSVLDETATPMGGRLMRQWLLAPLVQRAAIEARHDAVSALVRAPEVRAALHDALDGVRDVERLASKAAASRATPRELRALGDSLARLPRVRELTTTLVHEAEREVQSAGVLSLLVHEWDDFAELAHELQRVLVERPPLQLGDEPTIAVGVDAALDELRTIRDGGKDSIATIQAEERARTGINSLKVGFNRVFGYYLEISNANKHLVPEDYQRRQTLTGAERYVTPALKEYEEKVLGAADRIELRERELFEALRQQAGAQIARLQAVAYRVATLDVLLAFANVAERFQYVRPTLHDGFDLQITAGRHPVVERMMPREQFIPNDLALTGDARLIILTGPNMAGKSTILRQIGLIQLLAQVGAFVPARAASLPVADRVFTRVGASDNLVRGQSTFMVEMSETSAILHTATARSLVLLDEIGRGTATYDGVSIAWSVSEHLHDSIGCKTVFATHYHELTQLADELSSVRNCTVAVREVGDQVLFLHRLIDGGADRSYGIEVGRLAGLPSPVIARAKEVLALLEGDGAQMAARLTADGQQVPAGARTRGPVVHRRGAAEPPAQQLGFFGEEVRVEIRADPALEALAARLTALDPDRLTPLEALQLLSALRRDAITREAGPAA
jgi:DNA mismatch repair protein MutS